MSICQGSRVSVVGLKARPELNGSVGRVGQFAEGTGRWEVILDGKSLSVKPENLELQAGQEDEPDAGRADLAPCCYVRFAGAGCPKALAGLRGTVHGRLPGAEGMYEVWLDALPFDASRSKPAAVRLDCLTILPLAYRMEQMEGKGTGMVAETDIPRGAQVLAERPIFKTTAEEMLRASKAGGAAEEAMVERHLQRLTGEQRAHFWSLTDCGARGSEKTAHGIFNTNAITTGEGPPETWCNGLYLTACRFNHSCQPNVGRVWIECMEMMIFRATSDIKAGEELSIQYQEVSARRSDRQEALRENFSFTCTCEVCSLTGQAREKSDRLRVEYNQVDQQVLANASRTREALKMVSRQIAIVEEEHAGNCWFLMRAYYNGFQIALHGGDVKLAVSMLEKAITSRFHCKGGYYDPVDEKWHEWAANPASKLQQRR